MIYGGLLAGGSGTRMESAKIPKQFIEIAGIPIFIRTLSTFIEIPLISSVIVSININWEEKYYELIRKFNIPENKVVLVSGGESRFTSLINITKKAYELSEESILISHDCARVFCGREIIERNIAALSEYRIATTSIPVIDTIIHSEDGKTCHDVPERKQLWADQGPQSFYVKDFMNYIKELKETEYDQYIEAGKLFLANKCKVGIVQGDRLNFKITNDIDLNYAEFLIERGLV